MKKKYLFIGILFPLVVNAFSSNQNYFWYRGEKINLEKLPGKEFVLFDNALIKENAELEKSLNVFPTEIGKFNETDVLSTIQPFSKNNSNSSYIWSIVDKETKLIYNKYEKYIVYSGNFYTTPDKIEAGLSHLFYVKLKHADDVVILIDFANSTNVKILGNNKYLPLWYTLACTNESDGNALEMANMFYESGLFEAAQPDLMTDDRPLCVNDTYFSNQWALNNTGQNGGISGIDIGFCQTRNITLGNPSIIIAVIDHGLEMNHPDLTNIHPLSFDTESGTSPSQIFGNHGIRCAGIIGANSNNNLGVSGIAPNCQLMSISNSLAGTPNSRQKRADGFNFAVQNGAAIISNSWFSGVQYQILDDAIENALLNGRDGLGCVVVFSAGNNNNNNVSYPANSYDDILAVGAMSPCGERKNPSSCDGENWGSNYGWEIDVVAPGVFIPTTNLQGTYDMSFNGTSAAAPHVAAVAGLILSQNPNLTQNEVSEVISSTARKVGSYNYQTISGKPYGTWNTEVGYGSLDAFAALQQACITTYFENQTVTTNTTVNGCNVTIQNVLIQNNANFEVDANNEITIYGVFETQVGTTILLN